MQNSMTRKKWGLVTNIGWIIVCGLYFPVAIIGYMVFGSSLDGNDTILRSLSKFLGSYSVPFIVFANSLFTLHFICAIPIFLTPCLYSFNNYLKKQEINLPDKMTRIIVCVAIIIIALFFPYFTDVMSIVSDLSTSLAAMILPPLFYWKLMKPSKLEKCWLALIVVFGFIASVVGIYSAINDLLHNMREHPLDEFFATVFHFNMTKC